jgi:hypothetical protein
MRNALSHFCISCDPVLVDGNLVSARTILEGRFTRPPDMGTMGRAEPNARLVPSRDDQYFRFNEKGWLVEESAQSDNVTLMAQIGSLRLA